MLSKADTKNLVQLQLLMCQVQHTRNCGTQCAKLGTAMHQVQLISMRGCMVWWMGIFHTGQGAVWDGKIAGVGEG